MVNTRSQKRRGMPKRATRKNLKNRNAQTKRRGQQKGGEENTDISVEPTHMTLDEVRRQMENSLVGPANPDLPLTSKILVFDFDATLTTFAGHSRGREALLLNGEDKFGGELEDLISHLTLLKDAGYTLYINSRSSRCALLKFFGKLGYQQNNEEIKRLGNLFTDIYGSSESNDGIKCNKMNMTNVPSTRASKWAAQKMMVIEDIITKHGGKENITELYFFDDEDGNITKFKETFKDNKFKGITVDKEGNNLFLLGDLKKMLPRAQRDDLVVTQGTDPGYNSGYGSPPPTLRTDNTSPQDDKPVVIKMNNMGKYEKPAFFAGDILLMFGCEPNKDCNFGIYYESSREKDNIKSMCRHLSKNDCEKINKDITQITYEMLEEKLKMSDDIFGSGQITYIKIDPQTLIVSYEKSKTVQPIDKHLSILLKKKPQQGGKKSKTKTKKSRATNAKNKRTRKSKK